MFKKWTMGFYTVETTSYDARTVIALKVDKVVKVSTAVIHFTVQFTLKKNTLKIRQVFIAQADGEEAGSPQGL